MLTQTPRLLDISRQAIRSLCRTTFEGVTSRRKVHYGLLRPATTRVPAQTYLLTEAKVVGSSLSGPSLVESSSTQPTTQRALALSQELLLGGVVLVGDGSKAFQAEFGQSGWSARVRADRQQHFAQAVLQLRMEARAKHYGLDRERSPGFSGAPGWTEA